MLVDRAVLGEVWRLRGKRGQVQTTGYSMQPMIKNGARLVVQPCDPQAVQPGDIALIQQNGGLVAHRIIFMQNHEDKMCLGHKGDNAHTIHVVYSQNLIGKVVQIRESERVLDLEQNFWRFTNRCLGWYWSRFWEIWCRVSRTKALPGSLIYLPLSSINQCLTPLILHLGCWFARIKGE